MANEIITTLHPQSDEDTNLYPNIKKENIPNEAIDINKLDDGIKSLLNSIDELHPSGVDTATNILAYTTNKGIYIGTDTGHWYYWDGTHYVDGGVYQAASGVSNTIEKDLYPSVKKTISENKYKCDREEVLVDFMNLCAPGFTNEGTYMTFRYVTVELNPDNQTEMRLRIYCSPTQSGKMITSHKDLENKPNWYLLFAEAYISLVDEVSINAFENLVEWEKPKKLRK